VLLFSLVVSSFSLVRAEQSVQRTLP